MRQIVLWGAGGHSRAVLSVLSVESLFMPVAVVDISPKKKDEKIDKISVITPDLFYKTYKSLNTSIFVSIGSDKERELYYERLTSERYACPNIIHPSSIISSSAEMGIGNFIGPMVNVGPHVRIGNANILNTGCNIEHESILGSFSQISPGAVICGRCQIGSRVFLGSNSTIIENIKVESSNIIGAGSVVVKHILSSHNTFVGVPARML